MNQRFILTTFAACVFMFAAIFALTTPKSIPAPMPAADAPPAEMYADCDAVRAANKAPLRADQPGYRAALDPNMNGLACETAGAPQPSSAANALPPQPSDPEPQPQPDVQPPVESQPAVSSSNLPPIN